MATETFQAQRDSYMEGLSFPNTNYGTATRLNLAVVYAAGEKAFVYRTIGNFDVSALSGATINTAKLVRYIDSVTNGGFDAKLSRCTRPSTWTEAGVTWNKYDGANAWTSGGGDYDDTTPGVVNYSEAAATGWDEITGLAGYVTDALNNRSGLVSIIIRCGDGEDPGATQQILVRSKEYATEEERWYLEVDYTAAATARPTAHSGVLGSANVGIY